MERTVDVATTESVAFTYELAGLGSRFIAVLVDFSIQIGVLIVLGLLVAWVASALPPASSTHRVLPEKIAAGIGVAIVSFSLFLLFFGYFIFFEWRFAGRTPGKRLLGIRVVRDGGFPLDFTAATIRNVVRMLEFALGFYAVSAISALLSRSNRRLGDYAAGTIVVRDGRFERSARPVYRERADDPLVAALSPAERELIRNFTARRESLGKDARRDLAARIAAAIRPKLAVNFNHLTDEDLLVHLTATAL